MQHPPRSSVLMHLDCELFVADLLEDENLSQNTQDSRSVLLSNFRVIHTRYFEEFPFPYSATLREEDSSDDNRSSILGRHSDDASIASDYQDEGASEFFEDFPMAPQDHTNILKQGNLLKRRDHSFFGSEWQKRWCVLNKNNFYYYGSDKDKQQKGSFYIKDYTVRLVSNPKKDPKKQSYFEFCAPGRRVYQFTTGSLEYDREWVDQIDFLLKDLNSSLIPCDEQDEAEEETYDDIEGVSGPPLPRPGAGQAPPSGKRGGVPNMWEDEDEEEEDEDIYEVLPEEDFLDSTDEGSEKDGKSDYANYYQCLWNCQADETDELTFHRGDLIYIISKEYNIHGWWVGELNGIVGIVPKDFLHPAYIL